MASLPSVASKNSLKLEQDLKKSPDISLAEKNSSISYQSVSERILGSLYLDYQEALTSLKVDESVESAFYIPLLEDCIAKKNLSQAQTVHAHISKTGSHQDLFLSTFLLNVYAKCGAMNHAYKLFSVLPRRNVVTWTALITGYAHNSHPEIAIQVFCQMLEAGAYPTNFTLGIVLSACAALSCLELAQQSHGYIIKYNIEPDLSIGNSLCSVYSKCRRLGSATRVFRKIPEKNVISWTTLISACGDNGEAETGVRLFIEMLSQNAEPNEFTLTSVLSLCCILQNLKLGKQVHSFSIKAGCHSNLRLRNSIMYLYLKSGMVDEARSLFDDMETTNLITWNAMIAGHAQRMDQEKDYLLVQRSGIEALRIFQKLNCSEKLKPDLFSFSSILTVCGHLIALEHGELVHAQTIKTGYLSDVVVGSSLVNMYNKCGRIEEAIKAFVEMPTRTLITWTSMITAYAQHGQSREALWLFKDMRMTGVKPNKVTFVAVLSACSRAGMVDEALNCFEIMKCEYKIKPVMDHYSCLIDMFARLGRLEEAFDFIEKMDIEPNEIIWSLLIAGCRSHGNMELGFYAADKLLELKPKDAETYMLLSNMYLSAGRFKDLSKVRKLMKEEKLGKFKDQSWIGIRGKVYSFLADDWLHPQSGLLHEFLNNLCEKAKYLGYVPGKSVQPVDEEDNEKGMKAAIHHSEQLAIAFGLISTPKETSIRVTKSIAMCRGCHSAVKVFSKLTEREIIIRDSRNFHKFVNGACCCGDFGSSI